VKSTADNYFETSLEHLARAQELFIGERVDRDYFAHYLSGLAVKCLLRAYLRIQTDGFESNHSLDYLAHRANFYDLVPVKKVEEYATIMAELTRRWNANHRYFSASDVKIYLHELKADANQRGDQFRNNARYALVQATEIVRLGERKWEK